MISRRRAGAERRANRHLALAHAAAREQQVGEIDAGHQQHEADAAEQQQQRRPHAADRLLVQRHDRGADDAVRCRDRPPPAAARCRRSPRSPAPRSTPGFRRPTTERNRALARQRGARRSCRLLAVDELQRQPGFDVRRSAEAARAEHRLVGEHEVGRHDADDRARLVLGCSARGRARSGSPPSRDRQKPVADHDRGRQPPAA